MPKDLSGWRQLRKKTRHLIDKAKVLGAREVDIENANEALDAFEYEVAWDTIVVQLDEYDISIDEEFYELAKDIAEDMKLPPERYVFLRELVRA